jgi:hypothetical protein
VLGYWSELCSCWLTQTGRCLLLVAHIGCSYFLNTDPDPDPGSKTNANPCVSGGSKTLLKGRKPGSFVNHGQFPCCWIRIRIPQCRSGFRTAKSMRIRIHSTAILTRKLSIKKGARYLGSIRRGSRSSRLGSRSSSLRSAVAAH